MGMSSGPFQMVVKVMAASDESLRTTGASRSPPQRGAGDVEGENWSLQEWREMAVLSRFPLWGEGDRGSFNWFPQGGKVTYESLQSVQEESMARTPQLVEMASVSYGPLQEVGRMGVLKETSQEMGKKEVKVSFPPRQVQVVSLLPDLLVYNNHSLLRTLPSMETFNGVLLCVEITGDALLVLWKVERSQLSDIITLAAKCSLEMQEQFGFSYTEVGLELQLKIGLSAGHVSQLIVGDEIRQYLLVTGQQVDNVRLAQSLAQAREVILSLNCWELCDRDVLEAEMLKGQKAMKLRYLKIFHPPDFDKHFEKCIDHLQHYPNDEVLLRKAVALASSRELELALRRVIALELSKVDIQESFYAIRSLMAIVFGIDACRPYKRQDILQSKLTGLWDETFYCLLNNQFFVKFPMSAEVSHMDNETKQKEEEMLFLRVLRKAAEEATLIFIIDEAQYIDAASWDFFGKTPLECPHLYSPVISPFASKELLPCASAQGIMKSPKTTGVVLQELEPSKLLEMARQALGVVSIPREMEIFLIQRSSGVPLYCEALLTDLHANEVLEFYRIPEEEKEEDEWDNLSTSAVKSIPYRAPLVSSKEDKELYICTTRKDVDLDTVLLPARLKGEQLIGWCSIAVAQLYSLSPSEQMAVKYAAVIGHTFTPELLLYILPEWTNKKMEETLMSLINSHVFECFGKEARATQAVGSCHLHTHLGPLTMQTLGPEESEDVRATAPSFSLQEELGMLQQDQAMRFCTPLLREGAYELWLGDQKKALNHKCATFLVHKAHKCRSCGGGDFVSLHRYALDTQMSNVDSLLGQGSKTKGTALVLPEETTKRLQTSLAQDAAKRTDVPLGQELTIETPMASCEGILVFEESKWPTGIVSIGSVPLSEETKTEDQLV
ncbi:hypothetical protein KIL84_007739 [Mauremys mutica]|uniref:Guanylate cyclase domain-containing protein n=1 Tax=Mauremys mutica TaxID=74926 RepID=A0A9D3X3D7_9SAUR|nr:hypothetical protein KIL84_007739 [Mauremys mutica]